MPSPLTEADKMKTIFTVFKQVDIMKLGIDWKVAADELGLKVTGLQARMKGIMKEGGVVGTTSAAKPAAAKKAAAGGAKRGLKPKAAKRKASEDEDEDGQVDEGEGEDGDGSGEEVRKVNGGKGKQAKGRGAKRVKMDTSDDEKHSDARNGGHDAGNEVEEWLSHQDGPGDEENNDTV